MANQLVPSSGSDRQVAIPGTPRWYEVHEQQSLGRFLGGLSVSVGTVGLGLSFMGRLEKRGLVAVVGAVLSGLGLWLIRKKYFRDPEALRSYLLKFKQLSILSNIEEFGWDNIFQVASPELFVEKLSSEIGPDKVGLDDVFLLYGVPNLQKMVSLSLLPREVLYHKLQLDLNSLNPAATQARPLMKRFRQYGKFLIETANIDADYLNQSLMRDPTTLQMSFEDLVSHGARELMADRMIKLEFLHTKFIAELRSGAWTWGAIRTKFAPWILDDGIVAPEDVSDVFKTAFYTSPFTDVVAENWPWPIQKYGLRLSIQPDEYQKFLELQQEWQTLTEDHRNVVETAKKAYAREEVLAGAKLGQATAKIEAEAEKQKRAILGTATPGDVGSTETPGGETAHKRKLHEVEAETTRSLSEAEHDMKASLTKAANERDKSISAADSKLASDKARVNKSWMGFLGQKFAPTSNNPSVGGINVTVNLIHNQSQLSPVASAPPM